MYEKKLYYEQIRLERKVLKLLLKMSIEGLFLIWAKREFQSLGAQTENAGLQWVFYKP